MDQIRLYLTLLGIITIVGVVFRKASVPTTLILVLVGMALSFVPNVPHIVIDPEVILNGFLPLLLYTATYTASWHAIKFNARPITFMSIGHVVFITILVAVAIHYMVPQFGWPLAFILGAVISPPDDVAILAIGEKIHMPARVVTVLRGEALLNDATALTIFKFALAALITHQFYPLQSVLEFIGIIVGETLYGILLGYIIGEIRLRVNEPILQTLISILTPYLAYIPASNICGSGVISTVVTGIYIGQKYWGRFPADVRLNARSVWATIEFSLQCILFLLVGLNLHYALAAISNVSIKKLAIYSVTILAILTIGRFIWVYAIVYLPRLLIPSLRKRDPYPPWQYPFIIAWSGMRGGISLAAALAVPTLPIVYGIHPNDLLVFLVFIAIIATLLLQGLSLPFVIKALGAHKHSHLEKDQEYHDELAVKIEMATAVLYWLAERADKIKADSHLAEDIQLQKKVYESNIMHMKILLEQSSDEVDHSHRKNRHDTNLLLTEIIAIERSQLEKSWRENKINHAVKNKLEKQLDLRTRHVETMV